MGLGAELLERVELPRGHPDGEDAVEEAGAEPDRRLRLHPVVEIERLRHGHLLGERADGEQRAPGIAEDGVDPLHLGADDPPAGEVHHRSRRAELREDVAGRGAVDDDQVPHGTATVGALRLIGDLADDEHVAGAGEAGGDELEHLRQRREPGEARHLEVDAQVLLQRLLGVEAEHADVGLYHLRLERRRRRAQSAGQVALGVDLDAEHPPSRVGAEECERGGDRALAGPALAGDEEEVAGEQPVEGAAARAGSRRRRAQLPPVPGAAAGAR